MFYDSFGGGGVPKKVKVNVIAMNCGGDRKYCVYC